MANFAYIKNSGRSISQLKLVYGVKDYDRAEWVAKQSGTIIKTVTGMKRTDVGLVGVESWDRQRMVNNVTENLIPTNLILSFPPGEACFVQPNELATVAFTSFVPLRDTKALPKHLPKYDTVSQKVELKKKHKRQKEPPAKNQGKRTQNKRNITCKRSDKYF